MLKKTTFSIVYLLIFAVSLHAQEVLPNNSPAVHWKTVNTPNFRVIFAEGFERAAQHVANTLETIHDPEAMGDKSPRKISLVLRNRYASSNGFVSLAPRRSEFFTMPPQNNQFAGTNSWLNLLAVHEYRHIAQFQQSRTGFTNIFYYLFGENTQSGMAFASVPRWFWEGDAVATETAMTNSGRGRILEFSRVFKTNILERKFFSYNKQHLTSFKDYVPDHYKLGYHFVNYLRRKTGDPKIWDKVTHSAFGLPFIPFTFSNALKKHTGHYLVDNYNQMMADMQQQLQSQLKDLKPSTFNQVTNRKTTAFTDYDNPQVLEDGSIVVLKSGIGDIDQLVRLSPEGEEMERFTTGIMNNTGMLSATQYKVVWNEFTFDARWRAKTYSVIKSFDFATHEVKTITKKSRYGGAGISPDGYKIVTSLTTVNNDNYLVVIDTYSGNEIKRYENPDNSFYSMARWSDDGSQLVALKTNDKGRSVVTVDYETGKETVIIPSGTENIGHPVLNKDYLFYNSPYNGIDNIYALKTSTGERFQVTKSKYGAYNPDIIDGTIVYNEHTVNGLDVVTTAFDPALWVPLANVVDRNMNLEEPIVEQEGHQNILDQVPDTEYPVKKYSAPGHMINIHSWGPYATTDINKAEFGVFSQDVLSTTTMKLGYTYDAQEGTGFASAGLSYQGLYPIIDFDLQKGQRTSNEGTLNNEIVKFEWDELGVETGLRIPWVFTRSKYYTQLEIGDKIGFTKISSFKNSVLEGSRLAPVNDSLAYFFRDQLNDGELVYNKANVTFLMLMKQSKRDIYSRFGQSLNLELYNTPYGGDFSGRLFATRYILYLPSPLQLISRNIGKHHSLFFRFGYQKRMAELSNDLYYFRNRIFKPRGYSYPDHEKFISASINYSLPLWYPDIALGPFVNFQRVRLNGFYDIGKGVGKNYFIEYTASPANVYYSTLDRSYHSVGAELFVDLNIMRFSPLITLGTRYSYLIDTGETNFDFLIVNIGI